MLIVGLCLLFLSMQMRGQEVEKPKSIAFHVFYTDFKTAQLIRTSSLGDVLKHGKWTALRAMQMGFGLNFRKTIRPAFDVMATLDGSATDYLFRDGTNSGSSKLLVDANAGLGVKLVNPANSLVPYVFGGAGASWYQGKAGLYFPAGLGLRLNLFNEAFILTDLQYRFAATSAVNHHFYYAIGAGTALGKAKKARPVPAELPLVAPVPEKPVLVEKKYRDLNIRVTDAQTGLPLPGVSVLLSGAEGAITAVSGPDGEVVFKQVIAGDYTLKGTLNGINTNSSVLQKSNFEEADVPLQITLTHHDLRFTLSGTVEDKSSHTPLSGVVVRITDKTNGEIRQVESSLDGKFNIQLEPASDFSLSARRSNYISNIENISTRGLNRSATLYVKLLLGIEEARADKTIRLNNIYYATGSSALRPEASSDLDRLVLFMKDNPSVNIEVASHTDSRGSAESNMQLSKRRAEEVLKYLTGKGISGHRIMAKGYGETRLLNGCADGVKCTEEQHEQNRRTEFRVIVN